MWFVKGSESAQNHPPAKVPCPVMHNNRCKLVHGKTGWCTEVDSDGVWYRKGGSGVPKHHLVAVGTPDRALRYGNADVTRETHNSGGHTSQQGFSVQHQRILYEVYFLEKWTLMDKEQKQQRI